MKYKTILSLFLFAYTIFNNSCSKKEEVVEPTETKPVQTNYAQLRNEWIYSALEKVYFWNDEIPAVDDFGSEKYPEKFYNKMLFTSIDKYSQYIEDTFDLNNSLSGEYYTNGIDPIFVEFENSNVGILVNYVLQGSSAERVGIKRGDWIYSFDGVRPNIYDYSELFLQECYTVQMGELNRYLGIVTQVEEYHNLCYEMINSDPIIYSEIFERYEDYPFGKRKIGYLVYNEFVSGKNNEFLNSLDAIFKNFKQEGIDDLIVDLRNNYGGEILPMLCLASAIAPKKYVEQNDIALTFEYNSNLNDSNSIVFSDTINYPKKVRFINGITNLDLRRVVFITTSRTSSASEALISSLQPYMNVVIVGENTAGKCFANWLIKDERFRFALYPVVSKTINVDGYTDFYDGLDPSYSVQEDISKFYYFGNTGDPFVSKALDVLLSNLKSGLVSLELSSSFTILENPISRQKARFNINK